MNIAILNFENETTPSKQNEPQAISIIKRLLCEATNMINNCLSIFFQIGEV